MPYPGQPLLCWEIKLHKLDLELGLRQPIKLTADVLPIQGIGGFSFLINFCLMRPESRPQGIRKKAPTRRRKGHGDRTRSTEVAAAFTAERSGEGESRFPQFLSTQPNVKFNQQWRRQS
jgi:hypothetical protein